MLLLRRAPTATTAAAAALALMGCSSRDAEPTATEPDPETEAAEATDETAEEVAPEVDENGDFIRILADHYPPQENDPVVVTFHEFSIERAEFDPHDLEGGEAELTIDLASLETDDQRRDEHLRSDDYLHIAEHPQARVVISDVERTGDDRYRASFDVSVHGMSATWPIELEVIERTDDAIRVRGEHTFDRMEFNVGMEEVGEDGDGVAREMRLEAELTVSPTA